MSPTTSFSIIAICTGNKNNLYWHAFEVLGGPHTKYCSMRRVLNKLMVVSGIEIPFSLLQVLKKDVFYMVTSKENSLKKSLL